MMKIISQYTYMLIVSVWMVYVAVTLLAPKVGADKYSLGDVQTMLLQLTILVPVLLIWMLAARGAVQFWSYTKLVVGSPEHAGLSKITNGLLGLLAYLVVLTLVGAVLPYFHKSELLDSAVVIKNHLPAVVAIVAFISIYRGSSDLLTSQGIHPSAKMNFVFWGLFSLFAAVMTWLFYTSPTSTLEQSPGIPAFVVPHQVIIFTLLLPYLVAWALGFYSSLKIFLYAKTVKGVIYRRALKQLMYGISMSVVFIIVLQLFSIATPKLQALNLGALIAVIYLLLILYGLGSFFIVRGSKQLALIETVK